jgi:hypothetical protein
MCTQTERYNALKNTLHVQESWKSMNPTISRDRFPLPSWGLDIWAAMRMWKCKGELIKSWRTDRLSDWLTTWSSNRWFTDRTASDPHTDRLTHQLAGWRDHWLAGGPTEQATDTESAHRSIPITRLDGVLRRISPTHFLPNYLMKLHFNIILPSMYNASWWSFSFTISDPHALFTSDPTIPFQGLIWLFS